MPTWVAIVTSVNLTSATNCAAWILCLVRPPAPAASAGVSGLRCEPDQFDRLGQRRFEFLPQDRIGCELVVGVEKRIGEEAALFQHLVSGAVKGCCAGRTA
jgi:hypothetical protein